MEKSKRIYIQVPNCLTRLASVCNFVVISCKYSFPDRDPSLLGNSDAGIAAKLFKLFFFTFIDVHLFMPVACGELL